MNDPEPIEPYLRTEDLPDDAIVVVRGGPIAAASSSRATFAVSTAGAIRAGGFELLPTYEAPHYDLLLTTAEYAEAERLLSLFGSSEPNPYKRRGR